jgi:hypothetical protein
MILRPVEIWCDFCSNWVRVNNKSVRSAEYNLKVVGWKIVIHKHSGKKHYCPNCAVEKER